MFVSSAKWYTREWAIALSTSLIKIKNRSGANIDPCSTPYETVRESDNNLIL